jgi:hypothetical protein
MTPISWPFREPSLMSARTASYVQAITREGDSFDYDRWLKRVRQQETEANQPSAPSNLCQGTIRNPIDASQMGSGTAEPIARKVQLRASIRQSRRSLNSTTSTERLQQWLEKIEVAWRRFQGNRTRDAVYDYLEAVFAIVLHFKVRRRIKRLLRAAFRYADMRFNKSADPFTAVIRCTSDHGVDNKLISKWARALRYVVKRKPPEMRLLEFIKGNGGLNECTRQFASHRKKTWLIKNTHFLIIEIPCPAGWTCWRPLISPLATEQQTF